MKQCYYRLCLMLFGLTLMSHLSYGQGTEDFGNFAETGSSYNDGSFTGVDGSTWTYLQCRGDQTITGTSPMLGRSRTPDAEVTSGTLSGGIATLNFDYKQAFSTNVSLDVYINESLITTVTSSGEQGATKNSGDITVDEAGDFVISFKNPSGGQVNIDNVTWTAFADLVIPSFITDYPIISNLNPAGFELEVQLDEAATVYYVVVANGSGTPSAAAIKGASATGLVASGSIVVENDNISYSDFITTLTSGVTYDIYLVAEDASGNITADLDVVEIADITPTADVLAPELESAYTSSEGISSTVYFEFSEAVTLSDTSGFSIMIAGSKGDITNVSGLETPTLTLTLSDEIHNGDALVFLYDANLGNVTDTAAAGNALQTIPDFVITNNATTSLVANLSELRTQATLDGNEFIVTGEIIVSYVNGSDIYAQDATGGILIANDGTLTASYVFGDGITSLQGTLSEAYGGVLELTPTVDLGAASSTGNSLEPSYITIAQLEGDVEAYESMWVGFEKVEFVDAGTLFDFGADNYDITDGTTTTTFRDGVGVDFSDPDMIPYGWLDLVGIVGDFFGAQVSPISETSWEDIFAPELAEDIHMSDTSFASVDVVYNYNEPATVFYKIIADADPVPTAEEVEAGGLSFDYVAGDVGINDTVTISGLTELTEYEVFFAAKDAAGNLSITDSISFSTNETSFDLDATVSSLGFIIPDTEISSLTNVGGDSASVFGFTIADGGTSDGTPTFVSSLSITPGASNTASWADRIEKAVLTSDAAVVATASSISNEAIEFTFGESGYEVADGEFTELILSIYLKTFVYDGDTIQMAIESDHAFSALETGTIFESTLAESLIGEKFTVQVEATALELTAPTSAQPNTMFSVVVNAVDANGSLDTLSRTASISIETGTGNLNGSNLTDALLSDGLYDWSDLQLDAAGEFTLTVTSGTLSETTETISVVDAVSAPSQILITEIATTPTAGEFIEIYNAGESTVLLDDYYLTDATFAGGDTYYYNIVSGTNTGGGDFGDFFSKFPAGSTIAPGEVQTIALNGSENFFTTYGVLPTYELYEDGGSADAIPDMLEAISGSINGQGGLSDGEVAILFYWDGTTDLVTDIDYVVWGDKVEAVDKTGISIDGPDGDSDASTYLDDITIENQSVIAETQHGSGNSWQRLDFTEGTEVKTAGNGVDGHNEMSENFGTTFAELTANPGEIIEPGSPLITVTSSLPASFGYVANGSSSEVSSFTVTTADLTTDLTITPPLGFELSVLEDFSGTVYTNASPLAITPVDGVITDSAVYVRFTPTAADGATYNGDITLESTDAETKTISVSGIEGEITGPSALSGVYINEILPDPNGGFNYDTDGSGAANTEDEFVEIYNSSESPVDISGWQLVDESSAFFTFPEATILAAGGYAGVMSMVQEGGTLPTPSAGNLAFAVGSGMSLSNGGENVALFDPNAGEYIQIKYGASESDADLGIAGTLVGIVEAWGGDTDGSSLVRDPDNTLNIVVHGEIPGAEPASFAEPIFDPNAPKISVATTAIEASFGNVVLGSDLTIDYTVSGTNLEGDVSIMAPSTFMISLDGTTYSTELTLSPTDGTLAETTISVKFTPTAEGSADSVIIHSSTNAPDVEVDVIGAGISEGVIFFSGFGVCADLDDFTTQSVSGDQVWECSEDGETGAGLLVTGFDYGAFTDKANEDWLISPELDLTSATVVDLSFDTDWAYDTTDIEIYVSSDYTNDVTTATWTQLDAFLDTASALGTWTSTGNISLPVGGTVNVAIKYTSTDEKAASWYIDNFKVIERQPFFEVSTANFNGDFGLLSAGEVSAATYVVVDSYGLTGDVTVTPPTGFEVSTTAAFTATGTATSPLTISPVETVVKDTVFIRFAPEVAGSFSGDVTISTDGYDDVTLAVSGSATATGGEELSNIDEALMSIYPNPVSTYLNISTELSEFSITIYNLSGTKVGSFQNQHVIDVSGLSDGLYMIQLMDANSKVIDKLKMVKY